MRLIILSCLALIGFNGQAQDWRTNVGRELEQHLSANEGQTVCVSILSPDTSITFKAGPRATLYNDSTLFRAGYLLILSQAYFAASLEARRKGFLEQMVTDRLTLQQLLTHQSGYPRYPWQMDSCDPASLAAFIRQYQLPEKPGFQMSFTGISLTENWLRENFRDYPEAVFREWGIVPRIAVADSSKLAHNKVLRQALPMDCWPFCMGCDSQGLFIHWKDARKLMGNILENELAWKRLMQPKAKTPLTHLKMALGFQLAENIKTLPLAMLASSDDGNTVFIGISPNTRTGIIVIGDTDEPVDNLGLKLMALFHRDILNFKP